ncbi:MAG: alpha/beta fold hydrolase [Gammaproteobacteria bacterium]
MKALLKISGIVLACFVLVTSLALLSIREPDRSVEELSVRWAPSPSTFVDIAGMSVHLRDEGPRDDAEPILLVHGTSASLHTWEGWVEGLRGTRRVITVDLPGFGLTGPAPDGDYSIAAYTRFIVQVLDALKVERAVVGGNSLGGQIAWETAAAFPQRVSRLVLVNAGGYPFVPESMPIGFVIARTPVLSKFMEWVLPRSVLEDSVRSVYGDPSQVTPALVDRYFELTLREGNRAALAARFRLPLSGDSMQRIPGLAQPTLIIWGGQDRLIPPDSAERFHRDIAGSRLVVFEDLGHVPHEEDPQRTLAAVTAFLSTP